MKKFASILIGIGVIGMLFTAKSFFTRETIQDKTTVDSKQIEDIVVEGNYGNVTIQPSESDDIEVRWEGVVSNGKSAEEVVAVKQQGSELNVNIGECRFFHISLFNFRLFNNLKVVITLPKKEFNSLIVNHDVGNTSLQGMAFNDLKVKTDVANITAKDIKTNATDIESDVGNISLENIEGTMYVESDVGNINIKNQVVDHDMEILTDVGNIELSLPEVPTDVTFDAHSSVGKVTVFGKKGSFIQEGTKHIVSLKTDVGKINVKASNQ